MPSIKRTEFLVQNLVAYKQQLAQTSFPRKRCVNSIYYFSSVVRFYSIVKGHLHLRCVAKM